MIETTADCSASAATVHECLTDVTAWALWSPHVASVRPADGTVHEGWTGEVRAFFSPTATTMLVTRVLDEGGYDWESEAGPFRLTYRNRVESTTSGSRLRFTATLHGPGATAIERLVGPLSARGQRRRMARLARLAELVEGRR